MGHDKSELSYESYSVSDIQDYQKTRKTDW